MNQTILQAAMYLKSEQFYIKHTKKIFKKNIKFSIDRFFINNLTATSARKKSQEPKDESFNDKKGKITRLFDRINTIFH